MKKNLFLFLIFIPLSPTYAADTQPRFYFSWGYNKEWYGRNNIRITQSDLQNNYIFLKVKGIDKTGWEDGVFNKDLTIPQYNYRLGYNINKKWAFELNFDHTKYQVSEQMLHIRGTYEGRIIDSAFARTRNNLAYELNNGANFFLFNMVRKINLYKDAKNILNVKLLLKGGAGFVYPHVENTIMGQNNKAHFQFGGLDIGLEVALNATIYKWFYIEYSNKTVYAWYRNLNIYNGTASQNLACYEMILSLGVRF